MRAQESNFFQKPLWCRETFAPSNYSLETMCFAIFERVLYSIQHTSNIHIFFLSSSSLFWNSYVNLVITQRTSRKSGYYPKGTSETEYIMYKAARACEVWTQSVTIYNIKTPPPTTFILFQKKEEEEEKQFILNEKRKLGTKAIELKTFLSLERVLNVICLR